MAEILAKQYYSVFSKPLSDETMSECDLCDYDLPTLSEVTITEEKIMKALSLMTNKPSPGPDGIPATALKKGGLLVRQALSDIFSSSMETGTVAQDMRDSLINPTWKGGDK